MATDYFSTFVQNLLGTPSPKGGMFSGTFVNPQTGMVDTSLMSEDARAYYADPFRRQNAINASLDEALKQKQVEKTVSGLLSGDGGGVDQGLNPYVAAYLDAGGGAAGMQAQQAAQFETFNTLPQIVQDIITSVAPGWVDQAATSWGQQNYGNITNYDFDTGEGAGATVTSLGALSDPNVAYTGVTNFDYGGGDSGGGGDSFGESFGGAISESGDL